MVAAGSKLDSVAMHDPWLARWNPRANCLAPRKLLNSASLPWRRTISTGKTKSAWPSKSVLHSRPTRSPAWKPACASLARKPRRPRWLAASPRGRTGYSSGRTRPANRARSSCSARDRRRASIGRECNVDQLPGPDSEQRRPWLQPHVAARAGTLAAGISEVVAGPRAARFPGGERLSAHRDLGGREGVGHVWICPHAGLSLGNLSLRPRSLTPH